MSDNELNALTSAIMTLVTEQKRTNELLTRLGVMIKAEIDGRGSQFVQLPNGNYLCPKHNTEMTKREKQGDTWYAHPITDEAGNKHYCRGYHCKSGPGYEL